MLKKIVVGLLLLLFFNVAACASSSVQAIIGQPLNRCSGLADNGCARSTVFIHNPDPAHFHSNMFGSLYVKGSGYANASGAYYFEQFPTLAFPGSHYNVGAEPEANLISISALASNPTAFHARFPSCTIASGTHLNRVICTPTSSYFQIRGWDLLGFNLDINCNPGQVVQLVDDYIEPGYNMANFNGQIYAGAQPGVYAGCRLEVYNSTINGASTATWNYLFGNTTTTPIGAPNSHYSCPASSSPAGGFTSGGLGGRYCWPQYSGPYVAFGIPELIDWATISSLTTPSLVIYDSLFTDLGARGFQTAVAGNVELHNSYIEEPTGVVAHFEISISNTTPIVETLPQTTVTLSANSPSPDTLTPAPAALTVGTAFKFNSSFASSGGPSDIVQGATYYVTTNTGTTLQFATSAGGTPVSGSNTPVSSGIIEQGFTIEGGSSPDVVYPLPTGLTSAQLAGTAPTSFNPSATGFGGIAANANTPYWLVNVNNSASPTTFEYATTYGGTPISSSPSTNVGGFIRWTATSPLPNQIYDGNSATNSTNTIGDDQTATFLTDISPTTGTNASFDTVAYTNNMAIFDLMSASTSFAPISTNPVSSTITFNQCLNALSQVVNCNISTQVGPTTTICVGSAPSSVTCPLSNHQLTTTGSTLNSIENDIVSFMNLNALSDPLIGNYQWAWLSESGTYNIHLRGPFTVKLGGTLLSAGSYTANQNSASYFVGGGFAGVQGLGSGHGMIFNGNWMSVFGGTGCTSYIYTTYPSAWTAEYAQAPVVTNPNNVNLLFPSSFPDPNINRGGASVGSSGCANTNH